MLVITNIVKEMDEIDPKLIKQWIIDSNVNASGYWQGTFKVTIVKDCLKMQDSWKMNMDIQKIHS